jgi:hypothetical protein
MERKFAETDATSERAEPLANLLRLSYEPMLAWRLDGSIEFWNAGAERFYGFYWTRRSGAAATLCCKPNFRSILSSCVHSFGMSGTGKPLPRNDQWKAPTPGCLVVLSMQ